MPSLSQRSRSTLLQIVIILAAAFLYTGVRYWIDQNAYRRAHSAYRNADCAAALPLYNQILSGFRLGDLGNIQQRALDEKTACLPYETAAARERDGNLPGALLAFGLYPDTQPDSPLATAASKQAARLLSGSPPDQLMNESACAKLGEILLNAGLDAADPALPGVYAQCAVIFSAVNAPQSAYSMDYALLSGYPDLPAAQSAAARLTHNRYACDTAGQLVQDPVFQQRAGFLPQVLETCGADYAQRNEFRDARRVYELFLAQFPAHPRAELVREALARTLIAEARQAGAGQINLPEKITGSGGTETTITIQNDSPQKVRLVFSGPETRIEELAPCAGCQVYQGSGPQYCPEQGPVGEYTLASGSYEVLVEAIDDRGVTPFTGSWQMEGGEYFSCFFIVEQDASYR